jgi:hypothetical protein
MVAFRGVRTGGMNVNMNVHLATRIKPQDQNSLIRREKTQARPGELSLLGVEGNSRGPKGQENLALG